MAHSKHQTRACQLTGTGTALVWKDLAEAELSFHLAVLAVGHKQLSGAGLTDHVEASLCLGVGAGGVAGAGAATGAGAGVGVGVSVGVAVGVSLGVSVRPVGLASETRTRVFTQDEDAIDVLASPSRLRATRLNSGPFDR
mgnify:CR=1 FL=1